MKGLSRKITAGSRGIFLLMVLGVVLFWVLGEACLPGEGLREEQSCRTLSEGWVRMLPDGSRNPVAVPGTCPADRLESVSIETVLPENLEEDTWLCTMGTWQELELYVDQIVRRRYSAEASRPFGTAHPSAYVFLKLSKEDAGKTFRITSISDSPYSGTLNTVYIGDRMGILAQLIRMHGGGLLLAVFLLALSGLSILLSTALRRFYHKEIILEYLAWGTFLASLWLVAGSKMRQFLFPNISVASALSYLAAMLAMFPLLIYMDGVQKQRYQKGYAVLEILIIADFAACTFLQVTGHAEFFDTALPMCLLAAASFAYILCSVCIDFRKKRLRSYRLAAAGVLVLALTAGWELAFRILRQEESNGMVFCIGLACLLALAIIENVRKLFYMERERQKAVLANEAKGRFLANMSHEIRTPINTVVGMNEMILRENRDIVIRGYAENIARASKTLLSLVNDVLDFSKIESGSLDIANSSYYLSSLLNDVIHVLKARAGTRHLEVRLNVDEDLPSILIGDEVRIRKVLNHLFSNSIKFTPEGTITFSAQGEWADEGGFVLSFSVADTGAGMPEEDLAKVSGSFDGEEADWGSAGEWGDGLGFNFVKHFVDEMHGHIRVRSVLGAGTLITVNIPQEIENADPIGNLQEAYEREQQELKKPREYLRAPEAFVLSVDDNEMNLAVVRGLLKRTGIQLDTALSGAECMEYSRRRKYDLIFMDHMMPDPDGISTLHRLRHEEGNPNISTPVVALTANAVAGSREEYIRAGFDEYLSKPVIAEKLEQMLQKYLPEEKVSFVKEKARDLPEEHSWEGILKDLTDQEAGKPLQEKAEGREDKNPMREKTEGEETENPKQEDPQGRETENLRRENPQGGEPAQGSVIDRSIGMPYCGNDGQMYLEILQAYYEQGQEYIKKLPELYDKKDWRNYSIIAHAVKSTSLTVGAVSVSRQAGRQELAAKAGRTKEVEQYWEPFYRDYKNALKEAAQMLGAEAAGNPQPEKGSAGEGPAQEYIEGCQTLLKQIQAYEMGEALEQIDALLSVRAEKALEEVRQYVHDFDYDSAEECLRHLLAGWEVTGNEKDNTGS